MMFTVIETVLISACVGFLGWLTNFVLFKFKKEHNEIAALKNGFRVLLSDRITQACIYFQGLGHIPALESKNLENMYVEYKNLGGNGTIEIMATQTMSLPKFSKNERGCCEDNK